MLIIVRTTSDGVQSSAVVCYFARARVRYNSSYYYYYYYNRRYAPTPVLQSSRTEEKREEEKDGGKITSAYWETVRRRRYFPVYSFHINDRPPTAGRRPRSRLTAVYRKYAFSHIFPSVCLIIIIPRVEIKHESPRKTCELQFPSSRTYCIRGFFYLRNIIIAIYF